ncbi:hypothetical protein T484DRAFT_1881257 [Baffinella frigidus]|nr:hypothetical protein T484DRAFT_1881257 [Cryptophyta sp. CCMP2293]
MEVVVGKGGGGADARLGAIGADGEDHAVLVGATREDAGGVESAAAAAPGEQIRIDGRLVEGEGQVGGEEAGGGGQQVVGGRGLTGEGAVGVVEHVTERGAMGDVPERGGPTPTQVDPNMGDDGLEGDEEDEEDEEDSVMLV